MNNKTCGVCGESKPETAEFFATNNKGGTLFRCRVCTASYNKEYYERRRSVEPRKRGRDEQRKNRTRHRWEIAKKYGVTVHDVETALETQGYSCAICHTSEDALDHAMHIDHNHKTGNFRGMLCRSCNLAIGMMKDNPRALRDAADYLERSQ